MKIAVLSPIHWKTPTKKYGPWETIASYITEGMVKRGHEVTLYATGDSTTKAKLRWVCPRPLMEDETLDPKAYQSLHTAMVFEEAEKFDIIHNHYDAFPLVFSHLIKTPVVTTLHGFSAGAEIIYQKYDQNSFLVSISLNQRKRFPNLNYFANVYHGIPVEEFPFNEKPEDYFCFLGRISPSKGVDQAILLSEKLGFKLVLAGIITDTDKKFYEDCVKPKLGKNLIYLGNLGEEKKEVLKKARGFIHLNTILEPFGLSMIEAMACGTPVIGKDNGSITEIVENNKTGFVVNSVSQAEEAIKKIDSIKRIDCRTRVEKYFSVEKMLDGYEKVYQDILSLKKS